jgi:hypothetical protein
MQPATTATHRRPGLDAALIVIGALLLAALIIALSTGKLTFNGSGGSGSAAATQSRALPPFTGVDLAGANNVDIHVGAPQSVVVHTDADLLDRVTTRVRSGRLVIATSPGRFAATTPTYVTVSVPSLDRLELAGAGNISVSGIEAQRLTVALPGSGNIHAAGKAARLDVTIAGSGTAELAGLTARDATADLSGSGTIMVTATRSLTASLSGDGTILYGGNPSRLIRKVTGTGTIGAG